MKPDSEETFVVRLTRPQVEALAAVVEQAKAAPAALPRRTVDPETGAVTQQFGASEALAAEGFGWLQSFTILMQADGSYSLSKVISDTGVELGVDPPTPFLLQVASRAAGLMRGQGVADPERPGFDLSVRGSGPLADWTGEGDWIDPANWGWACQKG